MQVSVQRKVCMFRMCLIVTENFLTLNFGIMVSPLFTHERTRYKLSFNLQIPISTDLQYTIHIEQLGLSKNNVV